jgi:hypothetical protein
MARATMLLPHHRAHLEGSGIAETTIERAEISSVDDAETARAELGWSAGASAPPTPAIRFPYPGTKYLRYKPDEPRQDKEGRLSKYEAPRGIPPRIYLPEDEQLSDASVPLWLVEGEKKGLVSVQAGLLAAAAPGVNTFHDSAARKSARGKGEELWTLHPDLTPLVRAGRTVIVLFDSDIDEKPNVVDAAARLVRMVRDRGAVAQIAYITPVVGQSKMGIDDLYVEIGRDNQKLQKILRSSVRPADPLDTLGWLAQNDRGWTREQKERELARAIQMLCAFSPEDAGESWIAEAVRCVERSKQDLRRQLKEARAKRKGRRQEPEVSGDWLDAPGYSIIPEGRNAGIWKENGDGDRPPKPVTAAPINIKETGAAEDGTYFVTLRYIYQGKEHALTVPREHVFGGDITKLSARGLTVNRASAPQVQIFLERQEQTHADSIPRIKVFTRPGWSADLRCFVLGRQVIGGEGRAVIDAEESFLDAFRPSGDPQHYIELCRSAIKHGPVARAMWASGYVGCLLRLVGRRSIVISLWGQSGSGKSASQGLSVSPWGLPDRQRITGDASVAGLEGSLVRACDGVLWLDDTQQTRSQALLSALSYQIAGSKGRTRGTAYGGLRETKDWLAVAHVSGEHPLMRAGAARGARNRTLELKVSPFSNREFAASLHRELAKHHGWTGPMFVEALLREYILTGNTHALAEQLREFEQALAPVPDETVMHVAVLVLADFLAHRHVFNEEFHRAHAGALTMGHEILQIARSAADYSVDTFDANYDAVVAWIAENDLAFEDKAPRRLGAVVSQENLEAPGFANRRVVAVFRQPLVEFSKKVEFDLEEFVEGLKVRNLLVPGEGGRSGRKTAELGPDRPRGYWIVLPGEVAEGGAQKRGGGAKPSVLKRSKSTSLLSSAAAGEKQGDVLGGGAQSEKTSSKTYTQSAAPIEGGKA